MSGGEEPFPTINKDELPVAPATDGYCAVTETRRSGSLMGAGKANWSVAV